MPPGEINRCTAASISPARAGIGGHEPLRALDDTETPEKFSLRDRAVRCKARGAGLLRQGGKLHVSGQVCRPRLDERIGVGVAAYGLQRVAESTARRGRSL